MTSELLKDFLQTHFGVDATSCTPLILGDSEFNGYVGSKGDRLILAGRIQMGYPVNPHPKRYLVFTLLGQQQLIIDTQDPYQVNSRMEVVFDKVYHTDLLTAIYAPVKTATFSNLGAILNTLYVQTHSTGSHTMDIAQTNGVVAAANALVSGQISGAFTWANKDAVLAAPVHVMQGSLGGIKYFGDSQAAISLDGFHVNDNTTPLHVYYQDAKIFKVTNNSPAAITGHKPYAAFASRSKTVAGNGGVDLTYFYDAAASAPQITMYIQNGTYVVDQIFADASTAQSIVTVNNGVLYVAFSSTKVLTELTVSQNTVVTQQRTITNNSGTSNDYVVDLQSQSGVNNGGTATLYFKSTGSTMKISGPFGTHTIQFLKAGVVVSSQLISNGVSFTCPDVTTFDQIKVIA